MTAATNPQANSAENPFPVRAVAIRVAVDVARDASTHNLWPFELMIALALGLGAALAGTALGSLLLLRSSRRPG